MNLFISPWKSSTPRALSRYLGTKLMRLENVDKPSGGVIVNWGCSSLRGASAARIINPPHNVRLASNKLLTLQALTHNKVPTLDFTQDRETAITWNAKNSIVAHTDVSGHSGSGLSRFEPNSDRSKIPFGQLFTKYFPKSTEMRILCIKNGDGYDTFYLEKKRVLPERYAEFGIATKPDWFIRTHTNGWIFARAVEVVQEAVDLATLTCRMLGLDFAAVDLLAKPLGDRLDIRVGEVNSAPGLEGATLEFFKTGLNRLVRGA